MVAELLTSFEPTPSSVAEIAKRLPAHERARLEWFPRALRTSFIEPLAAARPDELHARVDELMVDAVRIVLQLVDSIGVLGDQIDPVAMPGAPGQEDRRRACHDLIRQRLEPIDVIAADDLHEAYEWLRAISASISITVHAAPHDADAHAEQRQDGSTEARPPISDEQIRRALVGEARPLFRGLLLTVAALDLIECDRAPPSITEWCRLALDELHVTANALRAAGLPVPNEVQIPGWTAAAWRARRAAQPDRRPAPLFDFKPRAAMCPPGVIERIVEVLSPEQIWLFGSRARGTAGPESDWDLLVVVPDSAPMPLDNAAWHALRDVRRQRIEIVPIRRSELEADRQEFGSLAYVATTTGRLVYGS
jgi:predicted nucleotidyltransferase